MMNRFGDNLLHTGGNQYLIKEIVSRKVEFVIIGGLAVSWYVNSRIADDLDILVNPSETNSQLLFDSLVNLDLSGFQPTTFSSFNKQVRIKNQMLYAEILTPRINEVGFMDTFETANDGKLFSYPVKIASPSALIKMKEFALLNDSAMQNKHQEDIDNLKKII